MYTRQNKAATDQTHNKEIQIVIVYIQLRVSPFISAAMARQRDQESVLVSAVSVGQHRHRHHEVLAARWEAVRVAVRHGPPVPARALRGFILVDVLHCSPLNVHNLTYYVRRLPGKMGLREQGHRFLREEVVRAAPVDCLIVPSGVTDKDRELVDVEMAN